MEFSGAAPDAGVPLTDQFTLIFPFCRKLLKMRRRGDEWKAKERRLTTLPIVGCESEGVNFEEVLGKAGLISETDTALDALCYFSNF